MSTDKIIELLMYSIPAIITGGTAFLLLQKFFYIEENKRRFELLRENQKQSLPLRLQAYERMVLFLERIHPAQLLLRVSPPSSNTNDYATLLIHNIQTEFEHNLTQQIYLTNECWEIINKAKNSTIQTIRQTALDSEISSIEKYREHILLNLTQTEAPSVIAINFIKEELKRVF